MFGGPAQVQMALDKNKSYMGRRYVEVFKAKKLVSIQPYRFEACLHSPIDMQPAGDGRQAAAGTVKRVSTVACSLSQL